MQLAKVKVYGQKGNCRKRLEFTGSAVQTRGENRGGQRQRQRQGVDGT
jgi:hypothetical protein